VAAATVEPAAAIIAVPIVAVHVLGLPLGILVLIRLLARAFDAVRALRGRIRHGITSRRQTPRAPVGCCDPAQPAPT
jgi:hypothetical protein